MRAAFKKYLKELGWSEQRMIGGSYLYMEIEDRIAIVVPQIWRTASGADGYQIDLNASVTTHRFLDYCSFILQPTERSGYSFFRHHPPLRMYVQDISKEVAFDASAKVISWVKMLNLRDCLNTNISYPNEAAPLFSVYRFIALKLEGRESELMGIFEDLSTWNRGGFNRNITPELVERAIALDVSAGL